MNPTGHFHILLCIFALGLHTALSIPLDGPAAAAVPAEVAPEAVINASPVAAPAVAAPLAPAAPVSPGGSITEHKNQDGSTLTITRFNGPLPASAFPSNPYGYLHQNLYEAQVAQAENMALIYRNLNNLQYLSTNPYQAYFNNHHVVPSLWFPAFPFQYDSRGSAGGWGSPFGGPAFFNPWGYAPIPAGYQRTA